MLARFVVSACFLIDAGGLGGGSCSFDDDDFLTNALHTRFVKNTLPFESVDTYCITVSREVDLAFRIMY